QWVDVFLPSSSPVAAYRPAPVQTEAVHWHFGAVARSELISTWSLNTGSGFPLPGTTMRSGSVSVSGASVGRIVRPRSVRTGPEALARKWTSAPGQRPITSYGPTRSRAVKSG